DACQGDGEPLAASRRLFSTSLRPSASRMDGMNQAKDEGVHSQEHDQPRFISWLVDSPATARRDKEVRPRKKAQEKSQCTGAGAGEPSHQRHSSEKSQIRKVFTEEWVEEHAQSCTQGCDQNRSAITDKKRGSCPCHRFVLRGIALS